MTKKDYIKLAEVINTRRKSIKTSLLYGEITEEEETAHNMELTLVRNLLAVTLKNDNPAFDLDKFCKACEK